MSPDLDLGVRAVVGEFAQNSRFSGLGRELLGRWYTIFLGGMHCGRSRSYYEILEA